MEVSAEDLEEKEILVTRAAKYTSEKVVIFKMNQQQHRHPGKVHVI